MLDFDAEAHAYEVYDDVVAGLRSDVKRKTHQDPPAENHESGRTATMRGSLQHEVGQLA